MSDFIVKQLGIFLNLYKMAFQKLQRKKCKMYTNTLNLKLDFFYHIILNYLTYAA